MNKNKRLLIIIIYVHVQFLCNIFAEVPPKTFFIRPIEVICDYTFSDTSKWAITCRVWGLLKYYHPNVTKGEFDWDQVLIDMLDRIRESKTPEDVNAELMKMIKMTGEKEVSDDPAWNDSLNMNVNLCWLDHSFINEPIRQEIRKIASHTNEQPSQYIKLREDLAYVLIPSEREYSVELIQNFEYRLLALFRYWNIIYYFYPYKYLMDQSWDTTLLEFIPQFINASDVPSYHKAVRQIATRLNDGHGSTSVSPAFNHLGFKHISLIDSSTVVRIPPEGSMLERGDIILSVDAKDIRSYRDSISSLIPSSNRGFTNGAVNSVIFRDIMMGCSLKVMRNQYIISLTEKRKRIFNYVDTTSFYIVSPDICYVNLARWESIGFTNMIDSLKNFSKVIFDLRNYPSGLNHWNLFVYFIQTQRFNYAMATCPYLSHPGAFYQEECITQCPYELCQQCEKYNGNIVVLIYEATISGDETLAMMFRIHGITLVGTPTAGANGNVSRFNLPGNINVGYSGLGFFFPDGTQMQRTGIIPDIEVYPTMDDIMAGRDEVLEAAIKYLNSQ